MRPYFILCALALFTLQTSLFAGTESFNRETALAPTQPEAQKRATQMADEIRQGKGVQGLVAAHCGSSTKIEVTKIEVKEVLVPAQQGYETAYLGNVTFQLRCPGQIHGSRR